MRQFLWLSTIAVVAGGLSTSAEAQRVVRQSNGKFSVEFPGRCSVRYNRSFQMDRVDRHCTSYQRMQANRAIAQYRGNAYRGGPGRYGYSGAGRYRITDIRYDRVRFADNCRVYYSWVGQHLRSKGGCNSRQRSIADRAMQNWRRTSGYYPGGGGYRPGGSWNDISLLPSSDGGIHVRFSNHCDVYYSARGLRTRVDRNCSRNQIQRADAAARYYTPGVRF